jgi:beta-glucosidase-like glycosyl hydrolase
MRQRANNLRSLGITMDLAPVLDTASPSNPVDLENVRSFSENGSTAADYGLTFAKALKAGGVEPVVKHFPGLGHADGNTDVAPAHAALRDNDLVPFRRAIESGIGVIMVSHAMVAGLSGGQPASLSPATYAYLRQQMGFGGVALTDSLEAGAIRGAGYSIAGAAERAIEAGADMVMAVGAPFGDVVQRLEAAVTAGRLPLARVEDALQRVLAAKGLPVCRATGLTAAPAVSTHPVTWFTLSATLTEPFSNRPIAGETIVFSAGRTRLGSAITDASGRASSVGDPLALLREGGYSASYSGSTSYQAARTQAPVFG